MAVFVFSNKITFGKHLTKVKALVIFGAQQVGKTYTILSFGKESYKNTA